MSLDRVIHAVLFVVADHGGAGIGAAAAIMGWLAYCYYLQKEAMLTQGRQAVN